MLTHKQIWTAIDRLADKRGMTASGLARSAGLDPTTFNRSKREGSNGKQRWPSTESIAKILEATGISMDVFVGLMDQSGNRRYSTRYVPLIGFAQAGTNGFFDDGGFPAGAGWDEVAFPEIGDENAYALEIAGDSMLPVYRDGDVILVAPNASVRRGDRVVVKTTEGEVMAKVLARQSARRIELTSLNPEYENRTLELGQVSWIARILWASQ